MVIPHETLQLGPPPRLTEAPNIVDESFHLAALPLEPLRTASIARVTERVTRGTRG
jgi:hypothetical protein